MSFRSDHSEDHRRVTGHHACIVDPPTTVRDWGVYAVLDGLNSPEQVQVCHETILKATEGAVPRQRQPSVVSREFQTYAEECRRAVTIVFLVLDQVLKELLPEAEVVLTLVLQTGALLTTANVGHAHCVLDTGSSILQLSFDHTIEENEQEAYRLRQAGVYVAREKPHFANAASIGDNSFGRLRIWPCGLSVSRTLGGACSSPAVLPHPHIKQVCVPRTGCRIVMATSTTWDYITPDRAARLLRNISVRNAAGVLLSATSRAVQKPRDMLSVVVDLMPHSKSTFKQIARPASWNSLMEQPLAIAPVAPPRRRGLLRWFTFPRADQVLEHCTRKCHSRSSSIDTEVEVDLYADVDSLHTYSEQTEVLHACAALCERLGCNSKLLVRAESSERVDLVPLGVATKDEDFIRAASQPSCCALEHITPGLARVHVGVLAS